MKTYSLTLTIEPAGENDPLSLGWVKESVPAEPGECVLEPEFIHDLVACGMSLRQVAAMERVLVNKFGTFEPNDGSNTSRKKKAPCGPVICLDTGKIYENACKAAKDMDLDSGSVGKCCRGERKHVGGHNFKYAE